MAEQDEMTGPEHAAQVGQLTVVHTLTDGIRVVSLAGEIDHHTGDALRAALDASGGPEPRIIVDLAQVTFMDSSGINIFITAHRTLGEAGGWLRGRCWRRRDAHPAHRRRRRRHRLPRNPPPSPLRLTLPGRRVRRPRSCWWHVDCPTEPALSFAERAGSCATPPAQGSGLGVYSTPGYWVCGRWGRHRTHRPQYLVFCTRSHPLHLGPCLLPPSRPTLSVPGPGAPRLRHELRTPHE